MGSLTIHANKCFVLFLVDVKPGYYIILVLCVYVWRGKGRGLGMGKRVIGRTDAILNLSHGDQTKGLSFIQTIRTDHFEFACETGKSVLCRVA